MQQSRSNRQMKTPVKRCVLHNHGAPILSWSRPPPPQARLVETGAKKLTQLYTKLVAEGSSGSPPIAGLDFTPATFPPALLAHLKPLVAFLRGLPLPSTHPSHPASQVILTTLREAQRGYADMRGTWNRKSLETHAKRVVDRAETLDGVIAGKEFGTWVENLLRIAEVGVPFAAGLS